MKPSPAKGWQRFLRPISWGLSTALAAAAPKCGLCVFAYLSLAAGFGPELCGAPAQDGAFGKLAPIAAVALAGSALGLALRRLKRSH